MDSLRPSLRLNLRLSRSKISSRGGSHAADPRAWEPALLQNLDLLSLAKIAAKKQRR